MTTSLADLADLLQGRQSCRAFVDREVPQDLLDEVLKAAQRTASWCNSQPWQVIVTRGKATEDFRRALHEHAASGAPGSPDFAFPREYRGVHLQRRRDAGFRLYDTVGVQRDDKVGRARQSLENYRMFGAPHVAIISCDEALGTYGAVDCGGYVANFLLAAHAAGINTIPQAAIAHYSSFVRTHFGLGDDQRIVCGISFGYADRAHPGHRVAVERALVEQAVRTIL